MKRHVSFLPALLGIALLACLTVFLAAASAVADDPAPPAEPAAEQPAPSDTPAPEQPAPEQPAPEQPAPEQPAPEQPAPEQPAPEQPAPEQPKPEEAQAEKAEAPPTQEAAAPAPETSAEPAPASTEPGTPSADAAPAPTDGAAAEPAPAQSATPETNAPPPAEPAETVAPVDPNLALLGEYVGLVKAGKSKPRTVGLQVRPMGADVFEAAQYAGGLPGQGARKGPTILLGKRSEDYLALTGGPWLMVVEPDHCQVLDRQGRKLGRLERIVRESPTLGAPAPEGAEILFDGTSTDQFSGAQVTPDGLLQEGCDVRPLYQDFNLHAEFQLPFLPEGRDQGRGNSGLYLLSRYEVQVLDSFAQEPVFNGCGSLYRQRTPDWNMCLPPLVWQTYDIVFVAPRWSADGTKRKNARITVWLNGVKVHNNVEIPDKTGAGEVEAPALLPIRIQDHQNPVRFRNVWIIDRGASPAIKFPVFPPKPPEQPE